MYWTENKRAFVSDHYICDAPVNALLCVTTPPTRSLTLTSDLYAIVGPSLWFHGSAGRIWVVEEPGRGSTLVGRICRPFSPHLTITGYNWRSPKHRPMRNPRLSHRLRWLGPPHLRVVTLPGNDRLSPAVRVATRPAPFLPLVSFLSYHLTISLCLSSIRLSPLLPFRVPGLWSCAALLVPSSPLREVSFGTRISEFGPLQPGNHRGWGFCSKRI